MTFTQEDMDLAVECLAANGEPEWMALHSTNVYKMIKEQAIALLEQYGWVEETDNQQGAVTGKWIKIAQNRTWEAQVTTTTRGLTVYIASQAVSAIETIGPVDPLYHDLATLEERLIELQ